MSPTYKPINTRQSRSNTIQCMSTNNDQQYPHRRNILNNSMGLATLLVGSVHAASQRHILSADAATLSQTQYLSLDTLQRELDSRTDQFTLDNGMQFIVSQRRSAPIVSFHTYADVGAFEEEDSKTGVAHLLEHLAFKGTPTVGTTNFRKEAPLLDSMDEVFYTMLQETNPNKRKILENQLEQLQEQASAYQVPNAYGSLLSVQGAVGLNAATSHDATKYYCSLPSNKIELWFALESERFQAPVFREFYSEKKVVVEERRLRVDNSPLGPFQEEFAQRSLTNNYKRPVIGYDQDIKRLGRRDVASFFQQHYSPSSLTVAVVGDINPNTIRNLAEKYFGGKWNEGGTPGLACNGQGTSVEESLPRPLLPAPPLVAKSRAGPAVLRAYYRPCIRNVEVSTALDMVNDVLTGTRSARLYKELVLGGAALSMSSFSSFPGEKHPSLFTIYGIPTSGVTPKQLDELILGQIATIADKGPSPSELARYSKASRMSVLSSILQSNAALASSLASYQVLNGDWREIVRDLDRVESLTGQKVVDIVRQYLSLHNSFVGYIVDA